MEDFLNRVSTGDTVELDINNMYSEVGQVRGFQRVGGVWMVNLKNDVSTWQREAAYIVKVIR